MIADLGDRLGLEGCTRRSNRNLQRTAWLGATLALLAAACGGTDSASSATGGDTTTTDTGTGTAGGGQGGGQTTGGGGQAQGGQAQGGQAQGGQGQGGVAVECSKDADCDDKNACTADACNGGICKHVAAPFDDGDVCTTDACDPVNGISHTPVSVDDSDVCTTDACDPVGGISHTALAIDDEDVCTTDACDPVSGISHTAVAIDDSNACTADACDPKLGITHTGVVIDDSNACTTDACDPVSGVSHTAIAIDDNNACTADACDPVSGVSHTPVNTSDNDACTVDACDPVSGVSHTPVNSSDNNACTTDACDPVNGVSHTPVNTSDNDACTTDACDPVNGVSHTPVNTSDNDACTTDSCDPVNGVSHNQIVCNDNNLCTADSCNPQAGCVYTPKAIVPDGNGCTTDACDPATGNPKYTAIANCCGHSQCSNSFQLDAKSCSWGAGNDCATKVCVVDPYCCDTNWDAQCVAEAKDGAICPSSGAPIPNAAYAADVVFKDALQGTTMTVAWDGANYWSSSGGSNSGVREARYSAAGALLTTYSPNIDFRSVFTKGGNTTPVYAREYSSNLIKQQIAAGVFSNAITLSGGALDAQAAVVWNEDATELVAFNAGTITRWKASGALIGTVTLSGFGNLNGENAAPQNRGIVKAGGYYFTYSAGVLSAWDGSGARAKTTTLTAAGKSFDSYYSLSYANGRIFVVDAAGGSWRGYPIGAAGGQSFTCGCAHSYCTAGAALSVVCDPCVKKICEVDAYCCSTSWDGACVDETHSVCNIPQGAACK